VYNTASTFTILNKEPKMTRKYRRYTKELLEPIVQSSTSVRECLGKLDLQCTGGNYAHIKKKLKLFDIDASHFTGQSHAKGKPSKQKRPVEEYLNDTTPITSSRLRQKLIEAGYFEEKCYQCNRTEWEGHPIPLELHHKDKNHENNHLENLSILCSNCHSVGHK
jgi:hypothetical protein